jgi:diguanylate cyclase (GGDEF)-like protein
MLPETDRKGAFLAAERIRKKIEESVFRAYDETLKVTISAGLAVCPVDAVEAADLVERSDKALYTAKNSGKNIVCEYKG